MVFTFAGDSTMTRLFDAIEYYRSLFQMFRHGLTVSDGMQLKTTVNIQHFYSIDKGRFFSMGKAPVSAASPFAENKPPPSGGKSRVFTGLTL
jgi:hypothetical protein